MHSKLSITFRANAGVFGAPPTSGGMPIEMHFSIIIYEASLMVGTPRPRRYIASHIIERLGVINCPRTFFCSGQVYQPSVGACNTVASVNECCKKATSLLKANKTPQLDK